MGELADRDCAPCRGGVPPLKGSELSAFHGQLGDAWVVVDEHHLERAFRFKDFRQSLDFTNRVGELAETVNHHPDMHVAWGLCKVSVWTHVVDGLTEADFVFAAKVTRLFESPAP